MKDPAASNEPHSIRRLRKGDVSALSSLYSTHHRQLLHYIFKTTKSMRLAEDIVHDTFIRIWEKRAQIDEERPIKPLLYTIAKHELLNLLSRASRESEIMAEFERSATTIAETADTALFHKEQQALVDQAIAELPPRCRQVFEKCQVEGLSHREVAATLGISESTVNNQMVKAWAHIRRCLKTNERLVLLIAAITLNA